MTDLLNRLVLALLKDRNTEDEDLGKDKLGLLATAMRDVSSLSVAGHLLGELDLPRTVGSWSKLKERLEQVPPTDRFALLEQMEEHGQQHILLYRGKANALPTEASLDKVLKRQGTHLNDQTPLRISSDSHAVVRHEDSSITVKYVNEKSASRREVLTRIAGGRELRIIRHMKVRRVRMVRLHDDGLIEVRLGSIQNAERRTRHSYQSEAVELARMVVRAFAPNFGEISMQSLDSFRNAIWQHSAGSDRVVILAHKFRTDEGSEISLRARECTDNLSNDGLVSDTNENIQAADGVQHGPGEIHWLQHANGPSMTVAVRFHDDPNEFSPTRAGLKDDFDLVFRAMRDVGNF